MEPIEETRTAITFVTEPVMCTLYQAAQVKSTDDDALSELEIQKGILQLARGLTFLHADAKVIHGNLDLKSILVNKKGDWKIAGFGFTYSITSAPSAPYRYDDLNGAEYLRPCIDTLAPECVLDKRIDAASDAFSFGCLIYAMFSSGVYPMDGQGNIYQYKEVYDKLHWNKLENIPIALRDIVTSMLARTGRPSLGDFIQLPYFQSTLLATLHFLEVFVEKTPAVKEQFLTGLAPILTQFPKRILVNKILPILLAEMSDNQLAPCVLPNIIAICDMDYLTPVVFEDMVWPVLKLVFTTNGSMSLQTLLGSMDIIFKKCSQQLKKNEVIPLLFTLLDSPSAAIVQKSLQAISSVTDLIDFTMVRSSVFPKMMTLYASSTSLAVRVNVLGCVISMISKLDKVTVSDKLLPILRENRLRHPALYMAVIGVFDEVGKHHMDREMMARLVIPELWLLAVDVVLNPEQFKRTMGIVRDMETKVEELHLRYLQDSGTFQKLSQTPSSTGPNENGATRFEDLVKQSKTAAVKKQDTNPFVMSSEISSHMHPAITSSFTVNLPQSTKSIVSPANTNMMAAPILMKPPQEVPIVLMPTSWNTATLNNNIVQHMSQQPPIAWNMTTPQSIQWNMPVQSSLSATWNINQTQPKSTQKPSVDTDEFDPFK